MIRIGYNKAWGPVMLVAAAINVVLFAIGSGWIALGLAVMLAIFGVLYMIRPFLVITDSAIQAKNLMGITLRSFPFGELADLEVVPGGLIITSPRGGRQRLKISRWLVSQGDLQRLAARIDVARDARAAKADAEPAPEPAPAT